MTEKLDLNIKENWTLDNAEKITRELGYVLDEDFLRDLEQFIKEVVSPATVTSFLSTLAGSFFKNSKK